jgi:ABC-2 type transport system permease protein
MLALYGTWAKHSMLIQFQYRVANYFYMIGMVIEPVVYLVVWTTIAREQGGSIDGITPANFAAYYVVWTLVRNMNIVLTPFVWEERIKDGHFSAQLMRPVHPIHEDIAGFIGWKAVVIVLWLPLAAGLTVAFRPSLSPTVLQCAVFFVAIWGAFLIRAIIQWTLGLITFWTTRISAIFQFYYLSEMTLSGRLFPIQLLPDPIERITWFLPFRWCFGFPITALTGPITNRELLEGLAMQVLWIAFGIALLHLVFPRAVRRFSSVGG